MTHEIFCWQIDIQANWSSVKQNKNRKPILVENKVKVQVFLCFFLFFFSPQWFYCQWRHSGEAGWAGWRAGTAARQSCGWSRWTPRCWCSPDVHPSHPAGSRPVEQRGKQNVRQTVMNVLKDDERRSHHLMQWRRPADWPSSECKRERPTRRRSAESRKTHQD